MINTIKLFSDYDTRLGSKQSDILVIVKHCLTASKHRRKSPHLLTEKLPILTI